MIKESVTNDDFRARLELNWLKLVRFYTYNFFINKGKWRLFAAAKNICRHLPRNTLVKTRDGRQLAVDLTDKMCDTVFFFGNYEPYISRVVKHFIKEGDVCLDVGANFGWFTTLFSQQVGAAGKVHAFEPVPTVFVQLRRNVSLNDFSNNVALNQFGLADSEKTVEIHIFPNLPNGHTSLAAKPEHESYTVPIEIKPLNSYLSENKIEQVDFVKVDIEGAELMFLQGAQNLFKQAKLPVMLFEMALENSREFNYKPNDLIVFIKQQADYNFYAIDEINNQLLKIEGFDEQDIGANVLCLPKTAEVEKILINSGEKFR